MGWQPCCCGDTGDCNLCVASNTQQWHVDIPTMSRNILSPGTSCDTDTSPVLSIDLPPLDAEPPGDLFDCVTCNSTTIDPAGWQVAVADFSGFVCEDATEVVLCMRLQSLVGGDYWLTITLTVTSAGGFNDYYWDITFNESPFDCVTSANMEATFGQDLLSPTANGAYLNGSISATTSRL